MRKQRPDRNVVKKPLTQDENRFRILFENSADAQFFSEGDVIIDCNHAALQTMCCTQKSNILGHRMNEFFPAPQPDGNPSPEMAGEMFAKVKGAHRFGRVCRRVNGPDFTAEVALTMLSVNGRRLAHTAVREVTNHHSQPAMRDVELPYQTNDRFRQLFDGADAGIIVRDADTFELLDANRKFLEMYGYTLDELKRLPLGSLSAGESVEERRRYLLDHYRHVAQGGGSRTFQADSTRKDGSTFWAEMKVQRLALGDKNYMLTVSRDVTQLRTAEEALKRSEEAARLLAKETGVIAEIGRIISSSLDIEDVYERFADEVRKLIRSDRVLINLVNQHEGSITTAYTSGMEVAGRRKGVVFPIRGSVTEQMLGTRTPVLFQPESIEEVRNQFPGLVLAFQAGLRSRLSVLLISRGEVVGSLALWSKQLKAYGKRDIEMAESVANQIAGAIANARLFREYQRADEALRRSEERYRATVASIGDAVITTDANRRVTFLNQVAEDLTGWTNAEAAGQPLEYVFSIINEETRAVAENPVGRVLQWGHVVGLANHTALISRSGREIPIEDSAAPIRDADGNLIGVVMVFHDVTQKRRSEKELHRQADLIDLTPDAIIVMRPGGEITFWNRGAEMLYGWTKDEALGRQTHHIIETKFPQRLDQIKDQLRQTGRWSGELIHHTKDRREVVVQSYWLAEFDGQGEVVEILESNMDITERKQAEEALRESEARFRLVFHSVNDGISMRDAETFELLDANRRFCEMWGYTLEELKGMPLGSLTANASLDESRRGLIAQYKQAGEAVSGLLQWEGKKADGSTFWVERNVGRIKVVGGERLLTVTRDITERKRAEDKIKASLREKEVLLKEIHHRVKNNLQIISSLLYLQTKRTEHPGAVSALRESRNRVRSMALIHERLYQSPNLASVDMGEYTRSLVSDLQRSHVIEESSVRLTVNVGGVALGVTEAIPCGLIINELVSNALKHAFPKGNEGEITIQLQRAEANQVTLTVSDNGVGFPEHLDFKKSPSLGLTLINSLVEQLNGTIQLDRKGGTAFTITFD